MTVETLLVALGAVAAAVSVVLAIDEHRRRQAAERRADKLEDALASQREARWEAEERAAEARHRLEKFEEYYLFDRAPDGTFLPVDDEDLTRRDD